MKLAVPFLVVATLGVRWKGAASGTAEGGGPPPRPTRVVVETDKDDEPQDGVTFVHKRGQMAQDTIQAGLQPHAQELTDCYMTKVGRRRWLGGHVVLHWDVKSDGTVASVKLSESDLGNWDIEKCLLESARTATFGKPIGGDADFTVPLEFSARGNAQIWDEDKSLRAIGGQLAKLDACPDPKAMKAAKKPMQRSRTT